MPGDPGTEFPTTDELPVGDGVGRYNDFLMGDGKTYASIYWTPAIGANRVQGAIRDKWLSLGGAMGGLGYPMAEFEATYPDGGKEGRFATPGGPGPDGQPKASIFWTASTGAHYVLGAIRQEFQGCGGPGYGVGYPTTDELPTPDGIGRFNHFSGGASVYSTPSTGAHLIKGAIRDHWAALGWEAGPLGYPVTDELPTPDGVGRFNHFSRQDGGSIYWSPGTGAAAVLGAIRGKWAAMGWETGPLGYPSSDEYAIAGGRRSNFARGWINFYFADGSLQVGYW